MRKVYVSAFRLSTIMQRKEGANDNGFPYNLMHLICPKEMEDDFCFPPFLFKTLSP
jgi:hypothetical protein